MTKLAHKFVESIPETLEDGIIYISMEYATAIHNCCCGCGQQVVTPFSPTGWTLIFNGKISLDPSIGNWSFACKSHYWITNSEIEWAPKWSQKQIERGREKEDSERKAYFKRKPKSSFFSRFFDDNEH